MFALLAQFDVKNLINERKVIYLISEWTKTEIIFVSFSLFCRPTFCVI